MARRKVIVIDLPAPERSKLLRLSAFYRSGSCESVDFAISSQPANFQQLNFIYRRKLAGKRLGLFVYFEPDFGEFRVTRLSEIIMD